MVDHEPAQYRPRRAYVEAEPEPEPTPADEPTPPSPPVPPSPPATAATPPKPEPVALVDDEDQAKPLFREEAADADAATVRAPRSETPDAPPARTAGGGSSAERPLSFVPRKPRVDEEESTTLLPRTTAHRGVEAGDLVDDDDDHRRRLGRRTRLGLVIGGVAAVVVIGLAIIYAVSGVSAQPGTVDTPGSSTGPSASTAAPSSTALLADTTLLGPTGAKAIDTRRTWTVVKTTSGETADAPGPACIGADPLEGSPTPQQKVVRTLVADGKNPPGALHLAQAYASAEEASQAFKVTATALGTCAVTGDYIASGRVVTGAGDEAVGALTQSVSGSTTTGHSVLVARTGRVLDVVDAYEPKESPNVDAVAKALASVIGTQCQGAGGACAQSVEVSDGPPPAGGDEPGYLVTGDLPPASKSPAPWVGTAVEAPAADFTGSSCETVNWSTTAATAKGSRTYLLQDTPGIFGLNDIVLTLKDEATAKKLVDKINSDWKSCKERKLTATVANPVKVTGVGSDGAAISGYTTTVEQKAADATTRFRVGIAASGTKVAFTFLNPTNGMDLTSDQWNGVAVRAVQRATQAS